MGIFSLAGLQTIEWWIETGEGSLYPSFILLTLVAVWIFFASRTRVNDFDKALRTFESWINKLFDK